MKWTEIRIHTTNEAVEPISNILHESGASGVVIEDPDDMIKERDVSLGEIYKLNPDDYPEEGVYIKAYLQQSSVLEDIIDKIKQDISGLVKYEIDIGKNDVIVSEVDEEDWATAWKKYYKPVKISENMTIKPTWEKYEPVSENEVIIELDPGMAFGTGTHPTTVLSVQAIEKYISKDDVVLDIGSGSGVLSIAAALLGAKQVFAYDLDEIAVKSSSMNAELNHVGHQVSSKKNNLMEGVETVADMIVSNILAEIIVRFTDKAFHQLKPGGVFITSGIIQSKQKLVKEDLLRAGFEIVEVNEQEEWISYVARKPE